MKPSDTTHVLLLLLLFISWSLLINVCAISMQGCIEDVDHLMGE